MKQCSIFDRPFNHKNMPRTEEQFEEIREKRKKLILETALELFANEGYHNTSISRIANEAKISKGLLYNYFKSKEELLNEILSFGIDEFVNVFDQNKDGNLTDAEMIYFIDRIFEILQNNQKYWKLYFAIATQPTIFEKVLEKVQEFIEEYFRMMTAFFYHKDIEDPEAEAYLFGALMDGISMNFVMNPMGFPVEKVKKLIINKYLNIKNFE